MLSETLCKKGQNMTKNYLRRLSLALLLFLCVALFLSACQGTKVDPNLVTLKAVILHKAPTHRYADYTDPESDFCIQKGEEFIVELNFENPLGYSIFNVLIDDTYISNVKFLPGATPEKVMFAYTLPEPEESRTEREIVIKKFIFTYLGNPVEHTLAEPYKVTVLEDPRFSITLHLEGQPEEMTINYMQSLDLRISEVFLILIDNFRGVYTEPYGEGDKVDNYYFFKNTTLYVFSLNTFTFAPSEDASHYIVTGLSAAGSGILNQLIDIPATYEDKPVTQIANNAFAGKFFRYISIPDSVTKIGEGAFKNCSNLMNVRLNSTSSLSEIGKSAFEGTPNLTAFTLPGELTVIGENAFLNSGLKETQSNPGSVIIIPQQIMQIGKDAFRKTAAKEVRFAQGSTLIYMGDYAFAEMENLTKVSTKYGDDLEAKGIKTIGKNAFYRCKKLSSVSLGAGLEKIDDCAFYDCSALKSITLNKDVKNIGVQAFMQNDLTSFSVAQDSALLSIGNEAFRGNRNLAKLDLTNALNLNLIGLNPFYQCEKLREVRLGAETPPAVANSSDPADPTKRLLDLSYEYLKFYVKEDFLEAYNTDWAGISVPAGRQILIAAIENISGDGKWAAKQLDGGKVLLFDVFGSAADITVPSSLLGNPITEIGPYAFNPGLRSITLPASVEIIREKAFYNCTQLSQVNFGNLTSLREIGEDAFNSTAITSFVAKSALTVIKSKAFFGTNALVNADFREASALTIKSDAFLSSKVNNLYFGSGLQALESGAFSLCKNLVLLWFENPQPDGIHTAAFTNNNDFYTVSLPTEAALSAYRSASILSERATWESRS